MSGTKSDPGRVPVHGRRMHFMCDNFTLKPEAGLHDRKRDIFPLICAITAPKPLTTTMFALFALYCFMTWLLQKTVFHCFSLQSNRLALDFNCSKVLRIKTQNAIIAQRVWQNGAVIIKKAVSKSGASALH